MIRSVLTLGRPSGRTVLQIGAVLLGVSLLAACQSATARRAPLGLVTAYSMAPPAGGVALVSLPNSGPIASVQETRSSAGLRQRIILGGNRGRIDLTAASGRVWDDPAMAKPSRIGVAAELATLENGGSYRIVRQPVQNAYGPLGVAVNERCAYAWQWIDALPRLDQERFALRGVVSVSLRVHHCQRMPTAAEALLADLVRMRFGAVAEARPSITRRPRVVRQKPEGAKPMQASRPVAAQAPKASAPVPAVAVNGSRTLVMIPQGQAAQPYLTGPPQVAAEPAIQTVPRPANAGASTERLRFLTDSLPPSSKVSPPSDPAGGPARASAGSRPPSGW